MQQTKDILIVDDDELLTELIAHKLRYDGYSVRIATSGSEAFSALEKELPDAIVLDGMMADMDGLEVLNAIRDNPKTEKLLVLMLSARDLESDIVKAFEDGADEYMTKPFGVDELAARLKKLFLRSGRR